MGFYKGQSLTEMHLPWLHTAEKTILQNQQHAQMQSPWLRIAKAEIDMYVCKNLVPEIMAYLGSSDILIIDAAIEVCRWDYDGGGGQEPHWLHHRAEKQGVLSVIVTYSHDFIRCGENEYVELLLQFLLHYKQDGVCNVLSAIQKGCVNHHLVMEAMNQAWEIEHWTINNFLCDKKKRFTDERLCLLFL